MPIEQTYSTPFWTTTATFPQFAELAEDVVTPVPV